jgi:hypothetical protein
VEEGGCETVEVIEVVLETKKVALCRIEAVVGGVGVRNKE